MSDSDIPTDRFESGRRDFLRHAGGGLGALALASLLDIEARSDSTPQLPHYRPRAKSVIWCFIDGGPSAMDLFDPKPELNRLAGKPLPSTFKRPITPMGQTAHTPLLGTQRVFKQHGQSGIWVSDWYPEVATCVDEIAVVRSCIADGLNHVGSVCQMNTGSVLAGRPSLGAWTSYGIGSESDELPTYVVLLDNPSEPPGGTRNWGTGFLPATFQGTKFRDGKNPILYLRPPESMPAERQRNKLDFIQRLNHRHQTTRVVDDRLAARMASYELAYRMQSAASDVVAMGDETQETMDLYGIEKKETRRNGRNCLLARRLVERGVRFVQVYMGSGSKWDAHSDIEGNHSARCLESDRPIAGLVKDLKRRGMLDDTLVVWGGEFGRTPMSESGNGRDHNPYGFTIWMAGAGIKKGLTFGTTDEVGLYAVEAPTHVHDIHATILYCLGLDPLRLTYRHNGRNERATIDSGHVIEGILG